MSALLDSLRRGRQREADGAGRRTAHEDAVLASLGYAPARSARKARVFGVVAVMAAALLVWAGWRQLTGGDDPEVLSARTSIPQSAPELRIATSSVPEPLPASSPPPAQPDATSHRTITPPAVPEPTLDPLAAASAGRIDRASSAAASLPRNGRVLRTRPSASAGAIPASVPGSTPGTAERMRLALYYHRAGDFERALIQYRAILQQDELNAAAHNNLGMLYREKNLLDEAAREFERALLVDAEYVLARNNYGVTLLGQGHVAAAAAEFTRVLARDPSNVDAIVNLALAQKEANEAAQARATLLRAIGLSPRHAAAHYNLAVMADEAGDEARALEHYRTFLDTAGPEHAAHAPQVRARIDALSKR